MTILRRIAVVLTGLWILGCVIAFLGADDRTPRARTDALVLLVPLAIMWGFWWIVRGSKHAMLIWRGLAVTAVALTATLVIVNYVEDARREEANARARALVRAEEVVIEKLSVANSYGSYSANGRVRNLSAHTLESFHLVLWLDDCPKKDNSATDCATISNPTATVYLEVPARQSRDFSQRVTVGYPFNVHGDLRVRYAIVETRGRE